MLHVDNNPGFRNSNHNYSIQKQVSSNNHSVSDEYNNISHCYTEYSNAIESLQTVQFMKFLPSIYGSISASLVTCQCNILLMKKQITEFGHRTAPLEGECAGQKEHLFAAFHCLCFPLLPLFLQSDTLTQNRSELATERQKEDQVTMTHLESFHISHPKPHKKTHPNHTCKRRDKRWPTAAAISCE